MRLITEIIGYDVVDGSTGAIVAYAVPTREEAEQASTEGSVVVPVLKSRSHRVGYNVRQQESSE